MGSNKGGFKGKPNGEFPSFRNDHLMVQRGIGELNLEESEEGDWLVISRERDCKIRTENNYLGSPNSAPKSWGQPSMLARPHKSDHINRTNWHTPSAGFVCKPVGHRVMPPSSSFVNSSDNLKGLNYGGKRQPWGGSYDGMKVMNGGVMRHLDDFDDDFEDEDDVSSEEDEFDDEFDVETEDEIDGEFGHRFDDDRKVSRQAGHSTTTTHKEWVPGKQLAHNLSGHYGVPPMPGMYRNSDSWNVPCSQIGDYKPRPAGGEMIPQPFSYVNRGMPPVYPPPLGNQSVCSAGGMQGRNDGVKRQVSSIVDPYDVGDTSEDDDDDYSDDYVEAFDKKSAHMGRRSGVKKQGPPISTPNPWGQVGAHSLLNIPHNVPPMPWSGVPSQRPENRAVYLPVPFADKNVTARPFLPPPNAKHSTNSAAGVQAMGHMSKKDSSSNSNPSYTPGDASAFSRVFPGDVFKQHPSTDGKNASKERILPNMSTKSLEQRGKSQLPGIWGNGPVPSVLQAQHAGFRGPTGGQLMPQTAFCAKRGIMSQPLTPLSAKDVKNSISGAASSTMKAKNDGRKDEILSEVDPSDFDSDEEFDSDEQEIPRPAKMSYKIKSRKSEKTLEANCDVKQKNKLPENQQEEEKHCCKRQMKGSSDATNGCVHEKPQTEMKQAEKLDAPAPLSEGYKYRTKEAAKYMQCAPEMLKMMKVLEKALETKNRHREERQKLEKEFDDALENLLT